MKRRESDLTPAVEIVTPDLRRRLRGPSAIRTRYMDAVQAIHAEPDAAERAFMARQLVLCTLPHSDPGDTPRWLRRTGIGALVVQPGWNEETDKSYGYPYGSIPRLLLFWMTTEVQHRKNRDDLTDDQKRVLPLGRSLNEFMRKVGLNPYTGRGKRGDAPRLHNQMDRLFHSHISFRETAATENLKGKRESNLTIEESELWWDPRRPDQGTLWNSWIALGAVFYRILAEIAVPLDMRALRALKKSPLGLDLYAWVCYRAYAIVEQGLQPKDVEPVWWSVLARQMGAEYSDLANFKKKASRELTKIKRLYPGLKLTKVDGGFKIYADRLAVQKRALPGG